MGLLNVAETVNCRQNKLLNQQRSGELRTVFIATVCFGLLAHAFAYLNLEYSHDSLMIVSKDYRWQISLGRYLQPVYLRLRHTINAPWLLGIISLFYLACAIYLIIDMFSIRRRLEIIGICAVFSTYVTLTCLNATYLPWTDIFMLSMLFAVVGAWFTYRYKWGLIPGGLCVAVAMGLYQSYLTVFITLAMLYAIQYLITGKSWMKTVCVTLRAIGASIIGAVVYSLGLQIVLRLTRTELSQSYNGLSTLGDFSGVSIVLLLKKTYSYYIMSFLTSTVYQNRVAVLVNILLCCFLLAGAFICLYRKKAKLMEYVLLSAVFLFFPFGANFICFVSKGLVYELMTYSFVATYIAPILVINKLWENGSERGKIKVFWMQRGRIMLFICCMILTMGNVIAANQAYTKKKLVYDATQSIMTRILYSVENTDEYVPGQTKVLLVGSLEKNPYCQNYEDFRMLNSITSLSPDVSVTYMSKYSSYFTYVMNAKLVLTAAENDPVVAQNKKIDTMPAFPQKGYCRMIDETLVIKLSQ